MKQKNNKSIRRFYHVKQFMDGTKYLEWRKGKGIFAITSKGETRIDGWWTLKEMIENVRRGIFIEK